MIGKPFHSVHQERPRFTTQGNAPRPRYGWVISLAFWLTLFLCAGMYAAVALAPKLLRYAETRNRWRTNQQRLVMLEEKVGYLRQVARELQHDPEFAAELARIELNASRPGEERIPVDETLRLDAVNPAVVKPEEAFEHPWYLPALQQLAGNAALRRALLMAAAALLLFAFVFLHESQSRRLLRIGHAICATAGGLGQAARWVKRRYGGRCDNGPWGVG